MKRPWTPGPWPNLDHICNDEYLYTDAMLAVKSPEMAELLIELSEMRVGGYVYWEEQIELINQAKKLLKEIGYDPTMDTDPAD